MGAELSPETTPVIVGVGEALDRPAELGAAMEPLALMLAAARAAEADAGGPWLQAIDSLDVINCASWRYADLPERVAAAAGASLRRSSYTGVGGELPGKLLHEAALRIARGESDIALVCGAEAQHSVNRAKAAGFDLPWTPWARGAPRGERGDAMVHPLAVELGLMTPVTVYPLYDMASAAAWGQTPAEALAESGEVWARYSAVAAANPMSWIRKAFDARQITTPTPDNRLLAWPYTKLMVANPMVNQGAAVLVASLATARAHGVPEDRIVHVWGGASANEPRDFMARDQLHMSHAQDAVLEAALALAPAGFDAMELYSCFPCVPKMARRSLGLGPDYAPTVAGGLTFFGAPLSSYMLHAACAMTRRLRSEAGTGLLYGQGEFVTKHHALVLGSAPAATQLLQDASVQSLADSRRGHVPETIAPAPGPAAVESGTVLFERDGSVRHGAVVLRLEDGRRTLAPVAREDAASLTVLTDLDRSPVGRAGAIMADADGRMVWRVTT